MRPRDKNDRHPFPILELPSVCAVVCCPPDCRLPSRYWTANTAPALPYVRRQVKGRTNGAPHRTDVRAGNAGTNR